MLWEGCCRPRLSAERVQAGAGDVSSPAVTRSRDLPPNSDLAHSSACNTRRPWKLAVGV